MIYIYNDELQIYRGKDYMINDYIIIHHPTLGEICDFGEKKYFSFISQITSTPTDMKYVLYLSGKDWNNVSDYELFLGTYHLYSPESSGLIFGDLDFSNLISKLNTTNNEIVLCDENDNIIIDRSIYEIIVEYLRKLHNLKKNEERAMNETTRLVLLEEAKEQYENADNKEYYSTLLPLISTMTNMEGFKYNWSNVWDLKLNVFMDAVQRIQHIKNVDLLLASGYSGFGIDLKKITDKNSLNYFSRANES